MRIPDDEWIPARDKAAEEGETMTDVIRRALRRYVTGALLGALVLVSIGGTSQASAPSVAPASNVVTEAVFVAAVRTFGAGTAIANRSDAELIASGKAVCAGAGQGVGAYWSQVAATYSPKFAKAAGVTSYAQWVSLSLIHI